jgi:hypothetical protein
MSMKQCFRVSKSHAYSLSSFWSSEKRIVRSRSSDVLSRRIRLRTPNLPSGRLKKRLWWSRWRDVSRCRNAMRTHFLLPVHGKKRIWRCFISDVLSKAMALITYNLLSGRIKKRNVNSMKHFFKVSKGHGNSLCGSWTAKKATWTKSLKWCFM